MARRDWLVQKWQNHKLRTETVTNIVTGEWYVEWPDLAQTAEAPTIANVIEMGINHWTAVGGAILPSVRVPISKTADLRTEKSAARKRERRVRELWEASNASEIAALLWGDYAGTGSAVIGAWVNFHEMDPAKRNPFLLRYDPRHTYLLKDNQGNVTELLVARKISSGELAVMYPEWVQYFNENEDNDVEEWFWYEKDRMSYALVDVSKDGRAQKRTKLIVDEEWDLGFVPAWEVTRPSFDGERRGVFDQTIHILRTMHRLMLMTIFSTEEHAFPTIASYDAVNPEDFGPGAHIQLRSSEGRIDRVGPATHFDVKDLVARLGDEANRQSSFPQQLEGNPGASIVSARGINASMGALDARLALAHKQFEVGFGKVSGFLLALDEVFCDGEKTIVGDTRDTTAAEDFMPSKDIAGAWVAKATYGIGAGSDPANIEVRLSMHLGNGLISRETAREQLPFLEDPDAEPIKQFREAMQDSLVTGVLAMAQEGDPTVAARALRLVKSGEKSMEEIVEELVDLLAPPEPEQPAGAPGAGGGALEALQGAESLARGGQPGSAAQAPSGAGLPPLGQILGQDSRQIS
jgi:hypothetical protein